MMFSVICKGGASLITVVIQYMIVLSLNTY